MTSAMQFPLKFVTGIINHINAEHQTEMLMLAHGLAEQRWVQAAVLTQVDKAGITLALEANARKESVRISFEPPLEQTTALRPRLIALIQQAQEVLSESDPSITV